MRVSRQWAAPALILLALGCASPGGVRSNSSSGELTQADLAGTREATLYGAVQRLRPQWLRSRGTNLSGLTLFAQVFVDGTQRGDIDELRQIPLLDVTSVSFMSASDAATRFGTRAGTGGAILVSTR